ncbi:MAG: CDP-glycerol glycerophosphotransferase family protein [Candidatus Cloacimonetes bacterium]|nr:CDP-glycerol glycerophosphotransferase family protein [Candidatus Cloacimonadota bacterium]
MQLYYYANHIYQLSYSIPLYLRQGGTYLLNRYSRLIPFHRYLRGLQPIGKQGKKSLPPVKIINPDHLSLKDALILSHSNHHLQGGKDVIRVFIGHGTGDKPYGGNRITAENLLNYEYIFISGPKHLARLKDAGVTIPEERLVKIGNMRFDDYVNGLINKTAVMDHLGIIDRSRKNILYAPTWRFGKGSLKKCFYHFARQITKEHNLIVRPHHHETKHIPFLRLWARFNGIRHLYFSNSSDLAKNDTMFDFAISDLLISDTSSVLYEYLITGNPIIVVDTGYTKLQKMPDEMNILTITDSYGHHNDILELINKNLADRCRSDEYQTMLSACFYFNDGKSTERAEKFIKKFREL